MNRWHVTIDYFALLLRLLNLHISLSFWNLSTGLRSTNALNINFFLLLTKFLQPVDLAVFTTWFSFSPLAVPAPHLLLPFLAHQTPPPSKSQITYLDHPVVGVNFHIIWFDQPRQSCLDSPPHSLVSSSLSSSPLSSSIIFSLFHSRLKSYRFNKSLPSQLHFFTHWTAFMIMGLDRTYYAHQFILVFFSFIFFVYSVW